MNYRPQTTHGDSYVSFDRFESRAFEPGVEATRLGLDNWSQWAGNFRCIAGGQEFNAIKDD